MMKFIHTGDWHLGKLVHGRYMTEDQEYLLQSFIELVEKEKPDAVIISGDLYDRSIPPTEAIHLLNKVLYHINVTLQCPVLAISGNHDSAERLSFGSSWFKESNLHIVTNLEEALRPIKINGVDFYLLPYAEPAEVRYFLNDGTITTHEQATKAMIAAMELEDNRPSVLVAHAFVIGAKETESERALSVGGTGAISADVFEPFTYTALGHLHSPDAIKHDSIFYSGSLMKYSFSEIKQRKIVRVVTIEDNEWTMREEELKGKNDLREIVGKLDDLLSPTFYENQKRDDYLKVVLLDEGALIDPLYKLRQVYPNILHLERHQEVVDAKKNVPINKLDVKKREELDLFTEFYESMTNSPFTEEKREIVVQLMKKIKEEQQ
ncbi:exonuclease SbcCD subunit D [Mangrovibacillus cuniculi]